MYKGLYDILLYIFKGFHAILSLSVGFIYTLGLNTDGQLGVGNTKPQNAPAEVKFFEDKHAFVSRFNFKCKWDLHTKIGQ